MRAVHVWKYVEQRSVWIWGIVFVVKIYKNLTGIDSRCVVCVKEYAYITSQMNLGNILLWLWTFIIGVIDLNISSYIDIFFKIIWNMLQGEVVWIMYLENILLVAYIVFKTFLEK